MPQADRSTTARKVVSEATRQRILDSITEQVDTALAEEAGGDDSGAVHVHIHNGPTADVDPAAQPTARQAQAGDPYEARFATLETGMKKVTDTLDKIAKLVSDKGTTNPDGAQTGDPEPGDNQTKDSKALETGYKAVVADAEVLVPGFRVPVFDAAATREHTVDSMCAIRRKALDTFSATGDGRTMLETVAGIKDLDLVTMDCPAIASLFKSAAGAKRLLNNRSATGDALSVAQRLENQPPKSKVLSVKEINDMSAKAYPRPGAMAH